MRVTDLTKQSNILRNISNNSEKLQEIQGNLASGKRVTKLSDDPVAATQIQDYRTRLSYIDTLKRNIQNNFTWLDRTEAELGQMGDLLRRTKSLILAQANASGDSSTRRITAEEVQSIINAIIQAGNSKIGKLFIFSGGKTFTRPLEISSEIQPSLIKNDQEMVRSNKIIFEGNSSNLYVVRITKPGEIGRAHFIVSDDGGETWSREKTLLPEIELVNESGKPSDKVRMRMMDLTPPEGQEKLIFPEGVEFIHLPNPPVKYHGNNDERMVETGEGIKLPLNVSAEKILFKNEDDPKSIDVFNLLFSLKSALLDNDQNALEERLDELDLAFDQVLEGRAKIGSVRKEMDDRLKKLNNREFSNVRQMSELEDLDFAQAVVDMNITDARFKAALDTSARLIQPSLLDFLR